VKIYDINVDDGLADVGIIHYVILFNNNDVQFLRYQWFRNFPIDYG